MSGHVVLLGDSILDNRAYTAGAPDVLEHLRALLPAPWTASLLARDGATTMDLAPQVRHVPAEASHLVVSIGGNDCLRNSDLLDYRVRSTAEALGLFGDRVAVFESRYRAAIQGALALGRPTAICTIYNGNLPPDMAKRALVGLTLFNDVILRVAFEHALDVIDLRLVLIQPSDYANPIEPSCSGGQKIATLITHWILEPESGAPRSRVLAAVPPGILG